MLCDVKSEPYPGLSVVPDDCMATYDRRTLPGEREEDVLAPLRETAAQVLGERGVRYRLSIAEDDFTTYAGTHVTAPNFAPAWFFGEQEPIVRESMLAPAEVGIEPRLSHYSFCTNGSGTAGRRGIPTVGFGPGSEDLAHRIDESIEIEELARGAAGFAAIAARLTGLEG